MPTIERYTKGILRERAVADNVNPRSVVDAGAGFEAAATVTGAAAEIADKFAIAHETTAVNEAIIKNKKTKMDFLEQKRKEFESNPIDFAKRIEPDLKKIDNQMEGMLPTGRAKKAFKERMDQLNLGVYEDNFQWSKQRQVEMFAQSVENATQDLGVMAYRRGEQGGSIDDLIRDAEATAIAGSTLVAPEKVQDISRKTRQTVVENYINAVAEKNPYQAKKLLASGKYDDVFDAQYLRGQSIYVDNKIKSLEKEAEEARILSGLLSNNEPSLVDPGNTDHRKMINNAFIKSGIADAFKQGDINASRALLDIYEKTSIIPDAAQSTLRGYMINGTQEQKAAAYTFVGKMQELNPVALTGPGGFSEKEIKDAAAYNQFIRSGADPQFAISAIQASSDPLQADVRDMRQAELKSVKKDGALKEMALEQINEAQEQINEAQGQNTWYNYLFSGKADFLEGAASAGILSKYEAIFDEEYLQRGSVEAAAAAAASVVNRYAGVTNIFGDNKIMEFPPEKYYSVPGLTPKENAQWMRDELEQSVKQINPNLTADDIMLVPAPQNRNLVDNGMKPKYYAWVKKNEYGEMDTLRGEDNLPVIVDFTQENGVKKRARKQAVDILEADRDFMLRAEAGNIMDKYTRRRVLEIEAMKSEALNPLDIVREVEKNTKEEQKKRIERAKQTIN